MKRTLAMLAAILLPFVAMSASYTNSFVRNGVTYVQRGGLTIKDFVVTNVTSSTGLTTNDVCNIVTNEVDSGYSDWVFYPVYWEAITAPPTYYESYGFWSMSITGSDMYALGGPNATRLEWHYEDDFDGEVLTVSTRQVVRVNALGLAMEKDLPQKTPVNEILFNGSDGNVYHLRIGSGGSIDIYTEVTP